MIGQKGKISEVDRVIEIKMYDNYFTPSKLEISKRSLIVGFNGIRSFDAKVKTLLSSITVFKDSIHIGSISPSNKIHFGPS